MSMPDDQRLPKAPSSEAPLTEEFSAGSAPAGPEDSAPSAGGSSRLGPAAASRRQSMLSLALCSALILVLVAADQYVKVLVSRDGGIHTTVIPNFLTFDYCENTGAAFSLFENTRFVLIGVTALLIFACAFVLFSRRVPSPFADIGLSLVIAGGASNLYDRIFKGYVVDFIATHFGFFDFAVFNVADSCVCVGAVLLCVWAILRERRKA